ncbi:MAG TPA: beta-propeller fold lactonase family protein, partial [Candidatus Kryptonia bacterium]|nr:beta-propeller fold lactonase family protein [Candidatus Kryptonia bacterium]
MNGWLTARLRTATWLLLVLLALPSRSHASFLTFVEALKNNVGGVSGLTDVLWVAISPDGRHLYAAGFADNAVVVLGRDSLTGALTLIETKVNGVDGVRGISGPTAIAVSPDGRHVYVAGGNENALAVFARDANTGMLTFVQVLRDGIAGVDGLMAPSAIAASPDGSSVYVAAFTSNALAVFTRDRSSGALTFTQVVPYTVGIIDGLRGASGVVVSPDGAHVYATGQVDNAVAVFSRNPISGTLQYVEVQRDGINGVDGLATASGV